MDFAKKTAWGTTNAFARRDTLESTVKTTTARTINVPLTVNAFLLMMDISANAILVIQATDKFDLPYESGFLFNLTNYR